jgi:hypothetical protein
MKERRGSWECRVCGHYNSMKELFCVWCVHSTGDEDDEVDTDDNAADDDDSGMGARSPAEPRLR